MFVVRHNIFLSEQSTTLCLAEHGPGPQQTSAPSTHDEQIKQVVLRQTWGEKTQLMRVGTRQLTQGLNAKQNLVLFHFRLADWGSPPPALLLVLNLSNSCSRVSSTNRTFVVEIWHEMERDGHRNRQKEKTEGLQHHYLTACLCVSTQNQQNKESLSYVTLPISAARLDPETEAG